MAEKDFLSQFTDENKKPESFKEEVRIPIKKENKFNPKTLFILLGVLAIIFVAIYFLFLRANINVVNFEGENKTDAIAWLKQQSIETSGVLFKEEYNFENAEGIIISQEPNNGRVKKNSKMTFVVSLGADPDESIKVPNLLSMTKEDIEDWIKDNKLLKTKINTTYDDTVIEGNVIKAEYSGCEEDSFTRGCSLKISISKGEKPKEEVTVEDFKGKTQIEAETWAKNNKITLKINEEYSNTIEVGKVISQYPAAKEKIKQGDTVTISVSKGKMVYMIELSGMTEKEVSKWFLENAIADYEISYRYNNTIAKDYVISYSPNKGVGIKDGTDVKVVISLGNKVSPFTGNSSYVDIEEYASKINSNGGEITVKLDPNKVYSDIYSKDEIVSIICTSKDGKTTYDLTHDVPMDAIYYVTVSKGKITELDFSACIDTETGKLITTKVVDYLKGLGISFDLYTTDYYCEIEHHHNDSSISSSDTRYYEGDTLKINDVK